jgi:SAM-dependent methyltransferase
VSEIEFLHRLRESELTESARFMKPGASILELGGGSGYQARTLATWGFEVQSLDLGSSLYKAFRVFPIVEYDGEHLPFPDQSFDLVYSSNLLEYIRHPEVLHGECRRVLREGGICIHVLPSASWRFWTWVTFFLSRVPRLWRALTRRQAPAPTGETQEMAAEPTPRQGLARRLFERFTPSRNGVMGNAFTEVFHFRRAGWAGYMGRYGFQILAQAPAGIFYTGHSFLGRRLSIPARKRLAKLLGSSCHLFLVKGGQEPAPSAGRPSGNH